MPKRLFIISDMQFNEIDRDSSTNFAEIERKYAESSYDRPQIVFWNVNGSSTDFPVTIEDDGTCLVAGASPSILKGIINSKNFDSVSIMRETLDQERYQIIKDKLS
jgi:hypothetical protein